MTREGVTRRLDRSGAAMGAATGAAQHVAPTEGGVLPKQMGGCYSTLVHVSPSLFGLFVLTRLTRAAPAVREKTGATPPFVPLVRLVDGGVLRPVRQPVRQHPPSTRGGRSRPYASLREG